MKRFPAIDIQFTPEAENAFLLHDRLAAGLDDFHPTAIEESPNLWRVFFDAPAARDRALAWLAALGDARVTAAAVDVEDEDWARRSQADVQPVRAGRLVITPPWSAPAARVSAGPNDIVIVIVPSTGFGTGHHASTRMCLEMLQEVEVRGRAVLDIGAGSGVLAIAAARLGAVTVTAVDNDPDAVSAARENVAINGVEAQVQLVCDDFPGAPVPLADVVVANLTGDTLRRVAAAIVSRANAGADLIVSGVLAEEETTVRSAFASAGATWRATKSADEWLALHFSRGKV